MSNVELTPAEDTPALAGARWFTPRRAILFVIAWLALFAAFSALVSNPFQSEPRAGVGPSYANVMFLHGLLIGMVGLMALVALSVLRIRAAHVRAWICAGVVAATVLASVGGIFDTKIPGAEVAMWTQILGFFALDEILVMLLWGIYSERDRALSAGRLPFVAAVASTFAMLSAAVMGHLAGWIMEFGAWPGFVGTYSGAAGFAKVDDFTGALVGSHSHEMAVGAMALAVTLLTVQAGYSRLTGAARWIARTGMAMVGGGTIAMALYYIVTGMTAWTPPSAVAQFGSDPNVIPVDDVLTGVFVMGGGVVAAAAFMSNLLRTPSRLAAAWSYLLATLTVAVAGYTIELNTSYFGAGDQSAAGAAGDAVFTWLHQDVGLFLLPGVLIVMLAAEILITSRRATAWIGVATLAGTTLLFAGGMAWVFVTPVLYGAGYWLSTAGVLIVGGAVLATVWHAGLATLLRAPAPAAPALRTAAR